MQVSHKPYVFGVCLQEQQRRADGTDMQWQRPMPYGRAQAARSNLCVPHRPHADVVQIEERLAVRAAVVHHLGEVCICRRPGQ